MIGQSLTMTRALPLTACCSSHVNATLLSCCAARVPPTKF